MYIVHVASECAPIAKVGGLGDVLFGLSQELAKQGHQVEIILPKYDCIDYGRLQNLKVEYRDLWSFDGIYRYNNTIWSGQVDGFKVFLIEPHHPEYYFSRGTIYGCPDDIERFVYFSRTALEYLFKAKKEPDVIHLHDWPTALIAPLYKEMYRPLGFHAGGILLTIHNLEHQGRCAPRNLNRIGLRGNAFLTPEKMQDALYPEALNLLKGGLVYADAITTVSPTYKKEILEPTGGFGLEKTLQKEKNKITGILNGIDETFWDPEKDSFLIAPYATHGIDTPEKLKSVLKGKAENRRQLRTHLGLKEGNFPIVGSVTRLVEQKGPLLLKQTLLRTLEKGGQFILLGAVSEPEAAAIFQDLKKEFNKHPHVAICLDKDEALAHLIFAGADIFAIPSLFEPCGLTQMIALRYGTLPIARATGGLADTVFDSDTSARPVEERNGFTFDFPDAAGVNWAVDRALATWFKDQKKWQRLMMQGMRFDLSWKHAATEYAHLYKSLSESPAHFLEAK